ncbi:MAG: hypothetical protein U0S36_14605 [Candidatus Nanopelagicales bacterium]
MSAHDLLATAHRHDPQTGAGAVLLDDGRLLPYGAEAFAAGGLRLLRPGQRVRVRLDGDLEAPGTRVVAVTLATFEL